MCCGVVPILFGWFLRIPSLHAPVFIRKTSLWLVSMVLRTMHVATSSLHNSLSDTQSSLRPIHTRMTPQHIYTIPTSCPILPTMHSKKTFHTLTKWTQYSALLTLQPSTFNSNKISQHNLKLHWSVYLHDTELCIHSTSTCIHTQCAHLIRSLYGLHLEQVLMILREQADTVAMPHRLL